MQLLPGQGSALGLTIFASLGRRQAIVKDEAPVIQVQGSYSDVRPFAPGAHHLFCIASCVPSHTASEKKNGFQVEPAALDRFSCRR